jgi:uncharacterized protein YegP (UPF0339 family)
MQPYFVLKAVYDEVIGTSEMYSSTTGRDKGIESVKLNAPNALVPTPHSPLRGFIAAPAADSFSILRSARSQRGVRDYLSP